MADSYPCPHCGEYLEVPSTMRAKPVRCASCQKVFTPGASNDVYDEPDRRGRRARLEDDSLPPRRSNRRFWIFFIGSIVLAGLVCCGGIGYIAYVLFNPEWQTYESTEQGFSAKFPGSVNEHLLATGRAGDEIAPTFLSEREMLQEEFEIKCIALTEKDRKKKPDILLNEIADAITATRATGKLERPRVRNTHNGFEAMEFAMKLKGGRHLQVQVILTSTKAYALIVSGPGDPNGSPWVQEFFDAFTVVEKAKPAK